MDLASHGVSLTSVARSWHQDGRLWHRDHHREWFYVSGWSQSSAFAHVLSRLTTGAKLVTACFAAAIGRLATGSSFAFVASSSFKATVVLVSLMALDSFGLACDEQASMDLALIMTTGPVSRSQPVAEACQVRLLAWSGDARRLLFISEGAHALH